MGEFWIMGPNALDLIQWVTSNDASKLTPGKVQYSCLPNTDGGIVDDLLVYCRGEARYLLVVNASNIDKDWAWLQQWVGSFDVKMENQSDAWSLLALQGPQAAALLQPHTMVGLSSLAYYTFAEGELMGFPGVILSASGYTGAGGFELYLPNNAAETVWKTLLDAGAVPAGLGARDTLRLEMGYCLYGNDIDDTTNPLEAGLGWITKFTKDFIQKTHLEEVKAQGPKRKLVGFVLQDRGVARHGYPILDEAGNRHNMSQKRAADEDGERAYAREGVCRLAQHKHIEGPTEREFGQAQDGCEAGGKLRIATREQQLASEDTHAVKYDPQPHACGRRQREGCPCGRVGSWHRRSDEQSDERGVPADYHHVVGEQHRARE
jgi:aminomethyltransferase